MPVVARLFALVCVASAVRRVAAQTVSVRVYSQGRSGFSPSCIDSLDNVVFAGTAAVGSCFGASSVVFLGTVSVSVSFMLSNGPSLGAGGGSPTVILSVYGGASCSGSGVQLGSNTFNGALSTCEERSFSLVQVGSITVGPTYRIAWTAQQSSALDSASASTIGIIVGASIGGIILVSIIIGSIVCCVRGTCCCCPAKQPGQLFAAPPVMIVQSPLVAAGGGAHYAGGQPMMMPLGYGQPQINFTQQQQQQPAQAAALKS